MTERFHKLQKFQKTSAIKKCQKVSRIQKCQHIFTNKKDVRKLGQKCRKICTNYKKCQKTVKMSENLQKLQKCQKKFFRNGILRFLTVSRFLVHFQTFWTLTKSCSDIFVLRSKSIFFDILNLKRNVLAVLPNSRILN